MHHQVDVIEQHPLGLVVPLDVRRAQPETLELLLDLIGDGLDLARVAAGAHDEVVGESTGRGIEMEDRDVFRFLRVAGFDRGMHGGADFLLGRCRGFRPGGTGGSAGAWCHSLVGVAFFGGVPPH